MLYDLSHNEVKPSEITHGLALHRTAQTRLALNHWPMLKKVQETALQTSFTTVFIEQFVDVSVHLLVSPPWDIVRETSHIGENYVSLEKEFLWCGCWHLHLAVIPYLIWTLSSSEPNLTSTSSGCTEPCDLSFVYWPTPDFNSFIKFPGQWRLASAPSIWSMTLLTSREGFIKWLRG